MHTAHALLQDSPIAVFASNPCLFIHFRTLCMQRRFATPFLSTTCALFPIQWGGGEYVVTRSLATCLPELQRVWSHSSGAILSIAPMQNTAFLQNTSNPFLCHTSGKSPVTPIIATLPKTSPRKSLVCHTYETPRGGAIPQFARSAFCFLPCLFARATMPGLEITRVGNRSPRRGYRSRSRLSGRRTPLRSSDANAFPDRPGRGNRQPPAAFRPPHFPQLRRHRHRSQPFLHRGSRPAPRALHQRRKSGEPRAAERRCHHLRPRGLLRNPFPVLQRLGRSLHPAFAHADGAHHQLRAERRIAQAE